MIYEVVAEGNANKILRRKDGSLIRVSKRGCDPSSIADYWNNFWKPRLGKYMGTMQVVSDAVCGSALLIDEVGFRGLGCEIVAEFKPKWLFQSPRAPSEAVRCRTCAVKSLRNQPLLWCSLGLQKRDRESIDMLIKHTAQSAHEAGIKKLLMETALLDDIAGMQRALVNDICHCMSLRDCTVLIEYSEHASQHYRAAIVDLDPKNWEEKFEKWEMTESQLQDHYVLPSDVCILSRCPPDVVTEPSNAIRSA